LLVFFSELCHCLVAMEACASAHHSAREIGKFGLEVRLIPPAYVKPFVKLWAPAHKFTNHEVPIMRRSAA
jgi:transposase